jgi:hypothetical protein
VKVRLLFLAVVTPLAAVGRPLWRRRLGLSPATNGETYWRRRGDTVTADALKRPR